MEPASAAVGLFNHCLHGYRAIALATEIGAEAVFWDVLMRIELTRFEIWGRCLGFLDETTGNEHSPDQPSTMAEAAEILQVKAAGDIVRDILISLQSTLDEFKKEAQKYRVDPQKKPKQHREKSRFEAQIKRAWESTKDLGAHLILVMNDKDKFNKLLERLTHFNDGLEKILSMGQKARLEKSLASRVLAKYDTYADLDLFEQKDASDVEFNSIQQHKYLIATAHIKKMCLMSTGNDDHNIDDYKISNELVNVSKTPEQDEYTLSYQTSTAEYRPNEEEPYVVLVEWRSVSPMSSKSLITEEELIRRRNAVVALLREGSRVGETTPYRVLESIGWFDFIRGAEATGFNSLIGFISRFPNWADTDCPPASLHTILSKSFNSEIPDTPSLRVRFQLAKDLSQALYQLQCSQWLHRMLSSHQIIFFNDKKTKELRLDCPYLTGFQYSRPDDQRVRRKFRNPMDKSQVESEGTPRKLDYLKLYVHPARWPGRSRRYRRSDDVYSLGVILFEIAFWEPVSACFDEGQRIEDPGIILETAKMELAAEVGDLYRDVVVGCLEGLRLNGLTSGVDTDYDGGYRGEDSEYGLESDLLWKVVRQIEKLRV